MAPLPTPTPDDVARSEADAEERRLLSRLREGDSVAFEMLVDRLTPSMLRVARAHVSTQAVAEEVVQDTWLGVLRGLDKFEGRSSVRTWVFRILMNQAKTRGVREKRTVPFASLAADETDGEFNAVDAARFQPAGHRVEGHWASPPPRWDEQPEARLESRETISAIRDAIDDLPPAQRNVITLRDVEGWDAAEVCDALGLTEGNQRVLLHRARSRVRQALENEFTT